MNAFVQAVYLALACLRHPGEIFLIFLGFGPWLQALLERRIMEIAPESKIATDALALELAYANLERIHERQGEHEKAAELVYEQANHPLLSASAPHAFLAAAHRVLEHRPDLAVRYVEAAKGYLGNEIFDREWLEGQVSRFEDVLKQKPGSKNPGE